LCSVSNRTAASSPKKERSEVRLVIQICKAQCPVNHQAMGASCASGIFQGGCLLRRLKKRKQKAHREEGLLLEVPMGAVGGAEGPHAPRRRPAMVRPEVGERQPRPAEEGRRRRLQLHENGGERGTVKRHREGRRVGRLEVLPEEAEEEVVRGAAQHAQELYPEGHGPRVPTPNETSEAAVEPGFKGTEREREREEERRRPCACEPGGAHNPNIRKTPGAQPHFENTARG